MASRHGLGSAFAGRARASRARRRRIDANLSPPQTGNADKEEIMRKILKTLVAPMTLAVVAGAALVATPAKADIVVNPIFPFIHVTPPGATYYYAPPAYYYRPNCYWDAYYGRVCY